VSCTNVAGFALGLENWVQTTLEDPTLPTEYYLRGVGKRITPALRQVSVVLALSSWPSAGYIHTLMEDDQVAGRVEELTDNLYSEMEWLADLLESTWKILADLAGVPGCSPQFCRHACLQAAGVSCAHIDWFGLAPYRKYPYLLCEGPPEPALDALVRDAQEKDLDPAFRNIRERRRRKIRPGDVLADVKNLRKSGKSSKRVDEGHGGMAAVHIPHKMYGPPSLCQHGFLNQMKALYMPPPPDPVVSKLERQLVAIQRKVPSKCNAWNIYVRDLQLVCQNEAAETFQNPVPLHVSLRNCSGYTELPAEVREQYEQQARVHSACAQAEQLSAIAHLRNMLVLQHHRIAQEAALGRSKQNLSSVRFDEDALLELDRRWSSGELTDCESVKEHEEKAMTPARPMQEQTRLRLLLQAGFQTRLAYLSGLSRPHTRVSNSSPLVARTCRDVRYGSGVSL
jgi:hypothetical protein